MEIGLCFLLILVWTFLYLKYTREATKGLITTYAKIFHIVVAGLAGWGMGDIIVKLVLQS